MEHKVIEYLINNNYTQRNSDDSIYVKPISHDLVIYAIIKHDGLEIMVSYNNLVKKPYKISYCHLISNDSIKSFIYGNILNDMLDKMIILSITKIFNALLFDKEFINIEESNIWKPESNEVVHEFSNRTNNIYNKLINDENNRNS